MKKGNRPTVEKNELPSHFADRMGVHYSESVSQSHKKEKGQFFTPIAIAKLMASFVESSAASLRILDPGCGTAVLSCALIEQLVDTKGTLQAIELVAYETDVELIPYTEYVLKYLQKWLKEKNVGLKFALHVEDFVLYNAHILTNANNLFPTPINPFDLIISNPPYFKLSKDDPRVKAAKIVVSGQTNIYSIFMAFAARLTKLDGQLIFITPRSYASGSYFKAFREFFFKTIELEHIHLFASRKDTFTRDSVLQETVILKGKRKDFFSDTKQVLVSSSNGLKDIDKLSSKYFDSKKIIDISTSEKILHLPVNDNEELLLSLVKSWDGTLNKYNIQISTGPVVAFRSKEFIQDHYQNGTVFLTPLFWLHNVNKMVLDWPVLKPNKGQYIRIENNSKSILIPNKNYVLLRRFSSKDDKSRLVAAPYFCNFMKASYIGVENKVNYIYRPKGHLDRNEVVGLCALLNSGLFDNYFRIFNGNVNVSATELREMALPPLDEIKEIGRQIILTNDYSMVNINSLINEFFSTTTVCEGNE
jgi:adenine-specific DNA-methyltransferase